MLLFICLLSSWGHSHGKCTALSETVSLIKKERKKIIKEHFAKHIWTGPHGSVFDSIVKQCYIYLLYWTITENILLTWMKWRNWKPVGYFREFRSWRKTSRPFQELFSFSGHELFLILGGILFFFFFNSWSNAVSVSGWRFFFTLRKR